MANTTETTPGNGAEVVQQTQEAIQKEINQAKAKSEEAQRELAKQLLQELKDSKVQAEKVFDDVKKTGKNAHPDEGKKSLQTLVRVVEAAKAGILLKDKPIAQQILKELANQKLQDSTAAAIQTQLGDYLIGQKDITLSPKDGQKTDFEKDLDALKQIYTPAAEVMTNSLVNQATSFGKTSSEMREKFGVVSPEVQKESTARQEENQLERDTSQYDMEHLHQSVLQEMATKGRDRNNYGYVFQNYYANYFKSEKELNLIAAIYDPNLFIKYVEHNINKFKTSQEPEYRDPREKLKKTAEQKLAIEKRPLSELDNELDKEIRMEVSEELSKTLTSMMDRIFVRLSRERASKPYEEIARDDPYHGIAATLTQLKSAVEGLSAGLEGIEEEYKRLGKKMPMLYRHEELEALQEEVDIGKEAEVGGKKETVKKTRIRIKQLPVPKGVALSEFVKNHLELIASEKSHIREYLHNGRSVYYHPAHGDQGFYGGLANYAESMHTTDIDSLFHLPDGHIAQDAFHMYSKYLFGMFSRSDWQHEPSNFTSQAHSRYSQLENDVLQSIQQMYPEIPLDRLESAVYMGVGMSRALFLNEPELAAYADPPLTPEGTLTGASYYTNDAAALNPFNPHHFFMRWQGENQIYPFLFMPVEGEGVSKRGPWDHKQMWEKMKQFKESYWKGRRELGNTKLFIDELVDMGNVGGPAKRRGWRQLFANEANLVYKEKTVTVDGQTKKIQTGSIDALKTWQSLEKVGYEVMQDLVLAGRLPRDLLEAKSDALKTERKNFFNYLFKTYFGKSEGELDAYLETIRGGGARDAAIKRIKNGEAAPDAVEYEVEYEVSQVFLHRALSRMITQRIPTRIIQVDRDRFDKEGKSRYKRLREALGWEPKDYDKTMRQLGLAEGLLRKQVSETVKSLIKLHNASDLKDITQYISEVEYKLTPEKIRSFLTGKVTGPELDQVIKLYETMQKIYTGNEEFLDKYAHENIRKEPFTFSFAMDELDLSLMAFRGAGPRMIARAIGDIGLMEQKLINGCIMKLKDTLHTVATDGKKDFSPYLAMLQGVRDAYGSVHGISPLGYETVHKIAAAIIAYHKKDTFSKGILGIFRFGKPASIAAEIAGGRSAAVWEWDAVDIDNFVVALETKRLLPRDRFDPSQPARHEPIWVNNPLTNKPIKLPGKTFKLFGKEIHLFQRRVTDYKTWYSDKLRREHGAKWYNIVFDFAVKYGPLFMAFMLYKFIKDAIEEAQGTKKK